MTSRLQIRSNIARVLTQAVVGPIPACATVWIDELSRRKAREKGESGDQV